MKAVKTRLVIYAVYIAIGVVLILLPAILQALNLHTFTDYGVGSISGVGGALVIMGLLRLVQYGKMYKDPQKAENWNNAVHEERTSFIVNKARAWTFYISVFVELAIALGAIWIFDSKLLGQAFLILACFQCVLSVILYKILNNKY